MKRQPAYFPYFCNVLFLTTTGLYFLYFNPDDVQHSSYQIKLPQFEGPFDLLLFFIERDELDIYNIPITRIINDFLDYIHQRKS